MKQKNPRWGALRISGTLKKLSIKVCKNTVVNTLRNAGIDPRPTGQGRGWFQFMKSHGRRILACDYFEVDTIFLKKISVFFMIDVRTRAITSFGVTTDRSSAWLKNHLRSALSFFDGPLPKAIVADRDGTYRYWLKPFLLDNYGIRLLQIPPRMPVFNCYAERMVRTF
jgi:transposase InsO family protein